MVLRLAPPTDIAVAALTVNGNVNFNGGYVAFGGSTTVTSSVNFTSAQGGAFSDPDAGVQRDIKCGGRGMAVSGGIKSDSLTVTGDTFLNSVATALTAAGTTQATALALAKRLNVLATVANGSGAILPGSVIGLERIVFNRGANSALIYPPSGSAVDALATNAGYSLAAGTSAIFTCVTATLWLHR